jgi:hypothetical protein
MSNFQIQKYYIYIYGTLSSVAENLGAGYTDPWLRLERRA